MMAITFFLTTLWTGKVLAEKGLETLLPVFNAQTGIRAAGEPQTAEGEELFQLINGGAVLYMKHHFKRAVFQEYVTDSGKTINLEIYHMGEPENAKAIYHEKKGGQGEKLNLGTQGELYGYYCTLWQDPYYITITGGGSGKDTQDALKDIARLVLDNIGK